MNLTTEQLKGIEDMANLLLPIPIMAANLELPELDLRLELNEKGSAAHTAYAKGYGKAVVDLHASILRSAGNGSNPAQLEALKFVQACKQDLEL